MTKVLDWGSPHYMLYEL